MPGAIVTGKVERHEKFGVFVFLSPGRTGLMPFAETGVDRDADMLKAFPSAATSRSWCSRSIRRAAAFASEEGGGGAAGAGGAARVRRAARRRADASLGSLADKLRGALGRR